MRTLSVGRPRLPRPLPPLLALLLSLTAAFGGEPRWSSHITDADGFILAAAGDDGGAPMRLTVSRDSDGEHLRVSTTFEHGLDGLAIRRDYDPNGSLTLRCNAGFEQLVIEVRPDPATDGVTASFHLPDGRRLALAIAADGAIVDGDPAEVRRALEGAGRIPALFRLYRRATRPLAGRLPAGGDPLLPGGADDILGAVESPGGCWDQCALGCEASCAFECLFPVACEICKASCALGCVIGCGPKKSTRE